MALESRSEPHEHPPASFSHITPEQPAAPSLLQEAEESLFCLDCSRSQGYLGSSGRGEKGRGCVKRHSSLQPSPLLQLPGEIREL